MNNKSETSREQNAARKRRFFRNIHIIIEILIFTVLVGITAFLLQPLRMSILREMTETRDYLIGEAESFLGRKIEYASMGPSIFATVDVRDIRVLNDDGEAVLTIGRFRLSYSLLDLIMGKKQNSLRSVRLDNPVINMDTERDADIISLLFPSSPDNAQNEVERSWQGIDFFPDEIQIRMRGGEGRVTHGNNEVSVGGLSFDGNIQNRRVIFTSRWQAETVLRGLFSQNTDLRMTGEIAGDFAADLTNGNLNLSIPTISGDLFTFKSITMNLAVSPELIELRKINDQSPYDLFIRYDLAANTLNAEFFADNFSLRDVFSFNGDWASYNEWLNIQTTGYASLVKNDDENIQYEVDLRGITPSQLAVADASFEIKSRGDSGRADFFPLRFDLPQGSILFEGDLQYQINENHPIALNGNLSINGLSFTGENPLSSDFSINTYNNEISIFSDTVSIGSLTLSVFDAYIIQEPNELSFTASALRFQDIESYENVSLSRVNIDASYELDPQHLQASFFLDSFSVNDMLEAASPFADTSAIPDTVKSQADNMLVTTEVFVTTDFEHVLYNVPRFIAAYSGVQDVLCLVSISGTDKRFQLNNGSFLTENTLDFSGDGDFSDIDNISFSFQAIYDDFSYFVDGLFLDQRSFHLSGSYGFNAYLTLTDQGNYSGSIFADSIPVPFEDGAALFSVSTFIRWTDPDFWSVDVERIELSNLPMPGNFLGHFFMQGIADNDGASFPNMYLDDGKGALTGSAQADWANSFSTAAGSMLLTDQNGDERYALDVHYADQTFDASISGSRMLLSRFMENADTITASADADVRWSSTESFSVSMNLLSLTGRIGANTIEAHAQISADQDSALVQNARLFFGGLDVDLPSLEIDLAASNVSALLNLSGTVIQRKLDAGLSVHAAFNPIDSWFQVPQAVSSFHGSLDVDTFLINAKQIWDPFQFNFSQTDTMLSIKGGPKEMIRFTMSKEGDFYVGLSNPAPLRGSLIGNILDGQIDAHTTRLYVDMLSLFAIVPDNVKKVINVPSGFVDVSVAIKGSLSEPEFFGTAQGTSIRITLPQYLTADIGPTPIFVKLDGTGMSFGPLITRVGDGRAEVSGNFIFNGWVPDMFTININVSEANAIPYGFDLGTFKAWGNASGKLLIHLEDQNFDIQGDLRAYDTIMTMGDMEQEMPMASEIDPGTASYATINMNISAGPRVEFLFPNESFPIVRAYANLGSGINVMADTRSGTFSITGDVGLRGGDIYYINRSFYIRQGEVHFDENELEFDPLITARADITEIAQNGRVTISLILNNAPVLSFTPRFESNPPLSQLEIMTLLGQGSSSGSSNPFISVTGDIFTQFAVIQNFQRRVRDFFKLDMFSLRTQMLQNAFFSMTGIQEPASSFSEIGNYFDNTSVYIGKYLTQDVFLQSMFSWQYADRENTLFGSGLGADIGLEFNSPLANIQLNFVPLHPENMFINDLSFTLNWKWTF